MSTLQQVQENLESADVSGPSTLIDRELDFIDKLVTAYKGLGFIGCTGCRYCLPCPQGVNIPQIFSLYNEYFVKEHITPESQAKRCARCRKCEELCPQRLPIPELLSKAVQLFEQDLPQRAAR
jgi:predicted aldo/keto reductase-like oxidoreductase